MNINTTNLGHHIRHQNANKNSTGVLNLAINNSLYNLKRNINKKSLIKTLAIGGAILTSYYFLPINSIIAHADINDLKNLASTSPEVISKTKKVADICTTITSNTNATTDGKFFINMLSCVLDDSELLSVIHAIRDIDFKDLLSILPTI